ncbi:MAG TPA: ATP-binding protein [Candidatus Limnocylindrales bacterium]|nr:ATP-binding protein [Candidatus Limnocylindrales bacterium]
MKGPITQRKILQVLITGFGLVILLLLTAALAGVQNIHSIQQNAADLLREQAVTNRLIDELHHQQTSLSEVFSVLARDPDSVDYGAILRQLDEAGRDIDRIVAEGARTPERDLWIRLKQASTDFSDEARRILSVENPETFASIDLFRDHEAFISVIARLIEAEYRKVNISQAAIDARSSRLLQDSVLFAAGSMLLALLLAFVTVRMALQLSRGLEQQTAELAQVSWQMLQDQEATARRFSHELHDELGQALTALKTNLTSMQSAGAGAGPRLEDSLKLVDESIGNVRQMSQLLRPTILDDFGLEAGVRWLAEGFAARTGIDVKVTSTLSGRLPDETETHLFRIAQEALTNVARHSGAKHVEIGLERSNGAFCLTVRDDGRGIDGSRTNGRGMGMIGMRARARSAGGDLTVRSRPGEGVAIEVRVPVSDEKNPHIAG